MINEFQRSCTRSEHQHESNMNVKKVSKEHELLHLATSLRRTEKSNLLKGTKEILSKGGTKPKVNKSEDKIFQILVIQEMEAKLENILETMMQSDNVVGALLSDNQGLCYGGEFTRV